MLILCAGFFGAFGAVMFAFGGASTFPTVQADMADKKKFKWAAVASCVALFAIYSSVMILGYREGGTVVHLHLVVHWILLISIL